MGGPHGRSRHWRAGATSASLAALVSVLLTAGSAAPPAPVLSSLPFVSQSVSFTADDGVVLHAGLGSFGPLRPRPLIVEDSPYAPAVSSLGWSGPAYNYLELQWRGTGLSGGSLDSTGPRDQQDLAEFLGWACRQAWSDGRTGLYGFSASAIVVYNAMHLGLPCVDAAALMSGTVDLYRDLLSIGGIPSPVVGSAVEGMIGAPWLQNLAGRLSQEPQTVPASAAGFAGAPVAVGANPTEDAFWQARSFQGDPTHIPVLADDGFYDVEERGALAAFEATRGDGSHLLVMGAHDGFPAGTGGPFAQFGAWFDHFLRGLDNGADGGPPVDVLLSDGSREQFLAGHVTRLTGGSWPLPGTRWTRLYLSAAPSRSVRSLNDGSLAPAPPAPAHQSYPFVPSEATETDVHTMATVAGDGLDQLARGVPDLTDMALSAPTSLTYTTPPLRRPVDAAGPVGLDLYASSSAPVTDLVAVVADVWPDGTAHPVATGQLRTAYPGVDPSRSLVDSAGDVVDPYARFDTAEPGLPGTVRQYHLEILPIGNHFAAGHRVRLYVLGTPGDMQPAPPGLDTLWLGGPTSSRLIFPTVGTSLAAALAPG